MKTNNILPLLLIVIALISCEEKLTPQQRSAIELEKINIFFEKAFQIKIDRSPTFQTNLGLKTNLDKWNNLSDSFSIEGLEITKQQLQWLIDSIDVELLDQSTKISYDLYVDACENEIEDFKYRYHDYPVNQMFGTHTSIPNTLINSHRIDSTSDALAYISRVKGTLPLFEQLISNIQKREEAGIMLPKFVYPRVMDDCKNVISGFPFEGEGVNSIAADFKAKIEKLEISDDEKRNLIEANDTALKTYFKPAYEKLISFLSEQETRANSDHGSWKFPDGEAFFNNALARTTTTDLTADEIHEIGLKEVARIHNEMRKIMGKVEFGGSLEEFFTFLKEDEQFYYPNTDEAKILYMDSATTIIDQMKLKLDELFISKPKADMVVKRVESFREKSAGKAFYQRPAKNGTRPGTYYANLYDTKNMPKFEMEALAYHEGIPGHHMQISIAQELEDLPEFRKYSHYTAYSEGWGLYCEYIPKEMGMYANPYSDYGRLAMELWRACRLVVDTGIHNKKWTREEGIAYYQNNTSASERECVRMVERHIVMPSQATAYKIGMLKILELRQKAKTALGTQFDIREFHDVVLTNGPIPLNLLEQLVDEWMVSKL